MHRGQRRDQLHDRLRNKHKRHTVLCRYTVKRLTYKPSVGDLGMTRGQFVLYVVLVGAFALAAVRFLGAV